MDTHECKSTVLIIFGATGDLTHRKLMPALYFLEKEKKISDDFQIIAIGRRNKTSESYIEEIVDSIKSNVSERLNHEILEKLAKRIQYHRQTFADDLGYQKLHNDIEAIHTCCNILYYLAVAPEYFDVIIEKLERYNMTQKEGAWRRVVIEKPFGRDLTTAEALNSRISSIFEEKDIYRIDHYLGKEMLQNMLVLRFANAFLEPIWNHQHIDNVQISSCETLGVETRGAYYESSGILRDMVQNHMLQLVMLTAMEPPKSFSEKHIRDEKLKVLESLTENMEKIETACGQYDSGTMDKKAVASYRQEDKVAGNSNVATFAAMKFILNNERWKDVPFYVRTGKRLEQKVTEVVIEFKHLPQMKNFENSEHIKPNTLVIKIHPEEGIEFKFNTKKPRTINDVVPVNMNFCQNCETGVSSPEAYERLLHDALRGDATLFTRWDEVKQSWILIDAILAKWGKKTLHFPNYKAGTWGPETAHELLGKDGRRWWVE
ncbi:MAG: glucose-6-phosphate dehydrogenase [Clostridiales bacterium]|nr:glucose-6-phosphate dehydrogenase [Clostridiales bacterium]